MNFPRTARGQASEEAKPMRLAVMSDIHGNSAALDAVLADISRLGADIIVNLGDSLSGPLDPVGTAERLIPAGFTTIMGNHDRWLIDRPFEEQPLWEQWTTPHLSQPHFDWIAGLPATKVVEGVLLTHGTPRSDSEDWLHVRGEMGVMRQAWLSEVAPKAEGHDYPVILSGHTHFPRVVRLPDGRLLVNPGAVGVPSYLDDRTDPPFVAETGAPDARYAMLDRVNGEWRPSLHVVPYDPTDMIARAEATGAASWAQALNTGWMLER
ncbi:metallophosphoesterase family protein [Ovoidimarina sediminis]|uniref:metallophosphoesterase family protein n=1 Tax=Ovoidimarina sediminis TaxID=3079856 RepID=UPI0029147163|nr:metallophosphoesterase family protein [Rhodophyticola sp. MJ-SS7]MDU8945405.1 metallophosphoesterase family protein [Rhodophyticola sp. MJ-SS7]